VITTGASGALLLAAAATIDRDDEILLADPGYPCNRHFLRLVEGGAQLVPVGPEVNYQLTADLVDRYWDKDTVGALVASPANPTGTVLNRDELASLSRATRERHGHLVVDEIYHGLTYGMDAPSVLEVDDGAFVLNSFSKYFGMTGWRLGWAIVPQEMVPVMERLAQNYYICPSAPTQYAALACFKPESLAICEERRLDLAQRRDLIVAGLKRIGLEVPVMPDGAFYVYIDVSKTGLASMEFCERALQEAHVALTPGNDFGVCSARDHVRLSYAASSEELNTAIERLAPFVQKQL
jgi:aspartate/methionine/tyrosine aminotransferase